MRTKPKFKIGQTVYDIGEDVTFKITNRLFDPSDGWIYQPGVGLVEWRFESDLRTRKPRKKTWCRTSYPHGLMTFEEHFLQEHHLATCELMLVLEKWAALERAAEEGKS